MGKYRKKPVVIDAMEWRGWNIAELNEFFKESHLLPTVFADGKAKIPALGGMVTAEKGDWIIKGVRGEFYPCKPDIFEQTYEAV